MRITSYFGDRNCGTGSDPLVLHFPEALMHFGPTRFAVLLSLVLATPAGVKMARSHCGRCGW